LSVERDASWHVFDANFDDYCLMD